MTQPAHLPPRPSHTFSMRTVEKLHQRFLGRSGTTTPAQNMSNIVEAMRQNLLRIEGVLSYRLDHPSTALTDTSEHHPPMSAFERIRVGHILADIVLDLFTISTSSSNATYDALVGNKGAFAGSMSQSCGVASLPCGGLPLMQRTRPGVWTPEGLDGVEGRLTPPEGVNASLIPLHTKAEVGHQSSYQPFVDGLKKGGGDEVLTTLLQTQQNHQQKRGLQDGVESDGCSTVFSHSGQRSTMNTPQHHQRAIKDMSAGHEGPPAGYHRHSAHVPVSGTENQMNLNPSRRMRPHESPLCVAGCQGALTHNESPISPTSMRFKSVQSLHSGGDSTTGQSQHAANPKKYYEIDFQRLNDFQRCLRVIQRLSLTDDAFEKFGLRYAIPGIRELHPDEVHSAKIRMDRHNDCLIDSFNPSESQESAQKSDTPQEQFLAHKRLQAHVSPCLSKDGNNVILHTVADVPVTDHDTPFDIQQSPSKSPLATQRSEKQLCNNPTREPPTPSAPCDKQCLPLFHGGRDIIVQKKDMNIFIAMVDATLRQVDQDIVGRLHIASADFGSSSGEDEVAYM